MINTGVIGIFQLHYSQYDDYKYPTGSHRTIEIMILIVRRLISITGLMLSSCIKTATPS